MSHVSGIMTVADMMQPNDLIAHVRRLEALGNQSVWLPDIFGREIYVTAGFILHHTTTIKVASGIAHMYGRDAICSAQAARTLSELSGGRFIQGLGVSNTLASEMRGIAWENPMQKTRQYVNAIRGPLPIHSPAVYPPVPIFIAAHGPKMLAVAGEVADGANTYMQTPEHTSQARRLVGPDKILNVVLPCCLTTDPMIGRAVGRAMVSIYLPLPAYQRQWATQGFSESDWTDGGSDRLVDTYVAWGSVQTIKARMQEHIDAGADSIIMAAGGSSPENSWDLLEALAPN